MVGASYTCISLPELLAQVVGWVCLVASGAALLVGIRQLFDTAPMLVIDEAGVHFIRSGHTVPWNAVKEIWTSEYRHNKFLSLKVDNLEQYIEAKSDWKNWGLKRFIGFNKAIGVGSLPINFSLFKPGIKEAMQYISELELPHLSGQ